MTDLDLSTTKMNLLTFSRWFICALRILSPNDEFAIHGNNFYDAFEAALKEARLHLPQFPADELLKNRDPIFGVYHEADEMILESEQDLLVSIQGRLARFTISKENAASELLETPDASKFFVIAKAFLRPPRLHRRILFQRELCEY